jgi:hypothetical protein
LSLLSGGSFIIYFTVWLYLYYNAPEGKRGADTAHTQMGRPTYEAPKASRKVLETEYTHTHTHTHTHRAHTHKQTHKLT